MSHYDLVKIKNVGEESFSKKFSHSETFSIGPGEVKIVQWELMDYLLGNPEYRGEERRREFLRLCRNYGIYEDEHLWSEAKPMLEVRSLDDESIVTIADDPEGKSVESATSTVNEKAVLEQQIQTLNRQMKALQSRLETDIRAEYSGPEAVEDEPSKVATGPRRGRER